MKTIYDLKINSARGESKSMASFKGQVLLIVNTASKCGFTPQFAGLQELYGKHKDRGLTILGFPCDQFRKQEFDDIEKTTGFCQLNYGVTFPMMAKVNVNGPHADPVFTYLKNEKGGFLSKSIKWNFTKFLIDRQGKVVKRYAPTVKPEQIEKDIVALL